MGTVLSHEICVNLLWQHYKTNALNAWIFKECRALFWDAVTLVADQLDPLRLVFKLCEVQDYP